MTRLDDPTVFWGLALVLVAVLGLFAYSLAVPRVPEGFTEVYFVGAPAVSADAVSFRFMVADHEGKAMDYVYRISLGGQLISEGRVSRVDGEAKPVELTHKLSAPLAAKAQLLVSVSRVGKPEPYTVWYWVGGPGGAGAGTGAVPAVGG